MKVAELVAAFVWALPFVSGFSPGSKLMSIPSSACSSLQLHETGDSCNDGGYMSRRSLLEVSTAAAFSAVLPFPSPSLAADDKGKVVVFGGSGYVGAYVSEILAGKGYSVIVLVKWLEQIKAN